VGGGKKKSYFFDGEGTALGAYGTKEEECEERVALPWNRRKKKKGEDSTRYIGRAPLISFTSKGEIGKDHCSSTFLEKEGKGGEGEREALPDLYKKKGRSLAFCPTIKEDTKEAPLSLVGEKERGEDLFIEA